MRNVKEKDHTSYTDLEQHLTLWFQIKQTQKISDDHGHVASSKRHVPQTLMTGL